MMRAGARSESAGVTADAREHGTGMAFLHINFKCAFYQWIFIVMHFIFVYHISNILNLSRKGLCT